MPGKRSSARSAAGRGQPQPEQRGREDCPHSRPAGDCPLPAALAVVQPRLIPPGCAHTSPVPVPEVSRLLQQNHSTFMEQGILQGRGCSSPSSQSPPSYAYFPTLFHATATPHSKGVDLGLWRACGGQNGTFPMKHRHSLRATNQEQPPGAGAEGETPILHRLTDVSRYQERLHQQD